MDANLVQKFIDIVGRAYAIQDQDVIAPYLVEPRGLYHGQTPLVLRPQTTLQVSNIMKLANETGTVIVPQGGNTGLVGAQQPDDTGNAIIVSLSQMNNIRHIDVHSNLVVVEAGVVLKSLQDKVDEAGRLFPLSLGSEASCQVGGNLSSNAGGTAVLAYGNMRELCYGLEVVLPDGRILEDLRFVKKDNSGYDLKDLFIGAEGTLGIITAAVLKIFPKPKGKAVAFIGLNSPMKVLELLNLAQLRAGVMLTGFELMAQIGMEMTLNYAKGIKAPLAAKHHWFVLLDISSFHSQEDANKILQDILETAWKDDTIEDAAIAQSIAQQNAFWRLREDMSPAQKIAGGSIKHDISVPVSSIPAFIAEAALIVEEMIPNARIVCFGHMGDGNLHYNISQPVDADTQAFLNLWAPLNRRIHSLVMRYQGAFSAEHGIGQLKRDDLIAFKSNVAIDLMKKIKGLLDENNIMNPGKIFKN